MTKPKKKNDNSLTIAQNRKARYNYHILEEMEAGLCLFGSEVKSLRSGGANIAEAYVEMNNEEAFLLNSYIAEYKQAYKNQNHEPYRKRKLLLHKKEIKKLSGKAQKKGLTIVPLSLYFNNKGIAKIKIALAEGKKLYDKRETEKKRDWEREKAKMLKNVNS